jgi:hypothetical protein
MVDFDELVTIDRNLVLTGIVGNGRRVKQLLAWRWRWDASLVMVVGCVRSSIAALRGRYHWSGHRQARRPQRQMRGCFVAEGLGTARINASGHKTVSSRRQPHHLGAYERRTFHWLAYGG